MTATRLFALTALASLPACRSVEPAVRAYACEDGRTVQVRYPDRETAVLAVAGRTYTLKVARSGSGARYVGQGWQWWTKGLTVGRLAPLGPGEDVASAQDVGCHAGAAAPRP